jgi:hypothetical protein
LEELEGPDVLWEQDAADGVVDHPEAMGYQPAQCFRALEPASASLLLYFADGTGKIPLANSFDVSSAVLTGLNSVYIQHFPQQ